MKNLSLKTYVFIAIFLSVGLAVVNDAWAFQNQRSQAAQLRRVFTEAVGQDFEIVRDEMKHRPRDTASDYWLVYVRPKRAGHYSLKYSYKFVKKWSSYSSDEGENEFSIGVGGKSCFRHNIPESGISNICLGDTLIIPILTANMTGHAFNLSFREQQPESLEESQKYFKSRQTYSAVEPQFNQLEANIRLLGTQRAEMPHRSCCAATVEYYAVFEALKPGRFNLGFSSFEGDKMPEDIIDPKAEGGTPIIIVNPGTPVTVVAPAEKTIHYGDNRRFSAYAGNNFITNLLILQPGDVFTLQYSTQILDYKLGTKRSNRPEISDLKPAVYKIPFGINRDWSFNEWLIGNLPKGD